MHEYTLVQGLIETAIQIGRENNAKKINKIVIHVGQFKNITEEQFFYNYELIKSTYNLLKETKIDLILDEGIIKCNSCIFEGPIHDFKQDHALELLASIRCPQCLSNDTTIICGLENYIDKIDVEK